MPRNRVQHQKGLSDDAFERLYPDEEACRIPAVDHRGGVKKRLSGRGLLGLADVRDDLLGGLARAAGRSRYG